MAEKRAVKEANEKRQMMNAEFQDFFGMSVDSEHWGTTASTTCETDTDSDSYDSPESPTIATSQLLHMHSGSKIGSGRAKAAAKPWYSRSGLTETPEPQAMTNHALTLRSAGINKKNSVVDSISSVNNISKGYRDVKESAPHHSRTHS
jgi:hypothetical protein